MEVISVVDGIATVLDGTTIRKIPVDSLPVSLIQKTNERCDLCPNSTAEEYVDGYSLTRRVWCKMCRGCHELHGVGFGTGRGQLWQKIDGQFRKVRG